MRAEADDLPVNCVDWHSAAAFCAWSGGRLPTAAEWEYAARSGGRDQRYPWGDDAPTCERVVMRDEEVGCGRGFGQVWRVCSKPAGNTTQGLCDMIGNVDEWVSDWFDAGYYERSPPANPQGPARGESREHRGANLNHWYDDEYGGLEAAARGRQRPDLKQDSLGFRCVRAPAGR